MESLRQNKALLNSILISGGVVVALTLGVLPELSAQFEIIDFPPDVSSIYFIFNTTNLQLIFFSFTFSLEYCYCKYFLPISFSRFLWIEYVCGYAVKEKWKCLRIPIIYLRSIMYHKWIDLLSHSKFEMFLCLRTFLLNKTFLIYGICFLSHSTEGYKTKQWAEGKSLPFNRE